MEPRAKQPERGPRAWRARAWPWGMRATVWAIGVALEATVAHTDPNLSFRGDGIAVILLAAGIPIGSAGHTAVPVVGWIAHVLFWLPALDWLWSKVGARKGHGVRVSGGAAATQR